MNFNFFIKNTICYFLEFCLNVGKFWGTFLDSFEHICIVAKSASWLAVIHVLVCVYQHAFHWTGFCEI
jgi:hypothetical protein